MKKIHLFFIVFTFSFSAFAQQPDKAKLEELSDQHWQKGLSLLTDIVSMPNDAFYPEQIEVNITWCEDQFNQRGYSLEKLETGGIPLLLVEKKNPNASKTVLFYFHVDGQAVDRPKWDQPDPYTPVLKEASGNGNWEIIPMDRLKNEYNEDWRIFARSSSDDKGPIAMFLTAWDALDEAGISPNYNVKIILDFEEEQGSPLLPKAVNTHKAKLAADLMLIMDGPRHTSNLPTLTYGARGIAEMTLTTYGPKLPQHSGHYGNYAPNPGFLLAQLVATMKDEEGRVTIPGYYDGIFFSESEKAALSAVPDNEEALNSRLGLGRTDKVGQTYQESIQYPSLNIRGMRSAWVGPEARTIVPAEAMAEFDIRLVKESDPNRLFELIEKHIASEGFTILDHEPTDEERAKFPKIVKMTKSISYQAFRTDIDSEVGDWLRGAMQRAFEEAPVQVRTSGGSVPISPFVDALGIPAVTVPTVNADNNQHSPNENLRLGNYREGIIACMAVLTEDL